MGAVPINKEKNMKVRKLVVIMSVVFLVISQSIVIAQERTTELNLGEDLVRELWNDFKTQNISALEKRLPQAFNQYMRMVQTTPRRN